MLNLKKYIITFAVTFFGIFCEAAPQANFEAFKRVVCPMTDDSRQLKLGGFISKECNLSTSFKDFQEKLNNWDKHCSRINDADAVGITQECTELSENARKLMIIYIKGAESASCSSSVRVEEKKSVR